MPLATTKLGYLFVVATIANMKIVMNMKPNCKAKAKYIQLVQVVATITIVTMIMTTTITTIITITTRTKHE